MRRIEVLPTLQLANLPNLSIGVSSYDPQGSGWCRADATGHKRWKAKNPAIVQAVHQAVPIQTAVELGVGFGAGLDMLRAHLGSEAHLIGVDNLSRAIAKGHETHLARFHAQPRTTLILDSTASSVASVRHALHGRTIDLLVIDADHRHDVAFGDLLRYAPLVAEEGLIYFDDADHNQVLDTVRFIPLLDQAFEIFAWGLEQHPSYACAWMSWRPGQRRQLTRHWWHRLAERLPAALWSRVS